MDETMIDDPRMTHIDESLREQIALNDHTISGLSAVIAHYLSQPNQALVNEAIIARIKGMLNDLAWQLVGAQAGHSVGLQDQAEIATIDALAHQLTQNRGLVDHCHVLALEGRLTEQLERSASLEQVLSPLMQELIASDQAEIAELAMAALTAQSSFVQHQSRMALEINHLPADLFHSVLAQWQEHANRHGIDLTLQSVESLRRGYDEVSTRVALLSRLIDAIGPAARAGLELGHAGLALFATALGSASNQSRQNAMISCTPGQLTRLIVALRAAGLSADEIAPSVALLDGAGALPAGFDQILPDQAQSILRDSEAGQT